MTFKQFESWCNERACDGCWSRRIAMFCIAVCHQVGKCRFWKRKKVWRELDIEQNIVRPINEKIKALMEEQT